MPWLFSALTYQHIVNHLDVGIQSNARCHLAQVGALLGVLKVGRTPESKSKVWIFEGLEFAALRKCERANQNGHSPPSKCADRRIRPGCLHVAARVSRQYAAANGKRAGHQHEQIDEGVLGTLVRNWTFETPKREQATISNVNARQVTKTGSFPLVLRCGRFRSLSNSYI